MRMKITAALTALALVGASLVAVTPADAQRHGRGGGHHGGGHHRGGGNVGAGLAGLAAGAILGGVLASQRPAYAEPGYAYEGGDDEEYCMSRFKSYDPRSGTYMGYDGRRHACP